MYIQAFVYDLPSTISNDIYLSSVSNNTVSKMSEADASH